MLEELKYKVYKANLALRDSGLVIYTWGNASELDRSSGLVVIKPSGVSYDEMQPRDMVVVDLFGNVVDGNLRPSSDMLTHLELYKAFPDIGGVVHTHSTNATAWAQAGRDIRIYGTTHADYFAGDIPCARALTTEEIAEEYEKNTGLVIVETLKNKCINPMHIPAVLCKNHGPFVWGEDSNAAVHNAVVLEEISKTARMTESINPAAEAAPDNIINKHFERKHGQNAYYGQNKF